MPELISDLFSGTLAALLALLGLVLATHAADTEIYVFGLGLVLFGFFFILTQIRRRASPQDRDYAKVETYNEAVVRKFIVASMFWGIVAFSAGVYLALELTFPKLNFGLDFLNFGRLRPVHTSAAIFAFGGSALFGSSFYVVQRTCKTRLFGGAALADFVFWGYQFFIIMAAASYVMGFSQGKEYAEPEWHIWGHYTYSRVGLDI